MRTTLPLYTTATSSLMRRSSASTSFLSGARHVSHRPLLHHLFSSSGESTLVVPAAAAAIISSTRHISSYGRITDEDRRWWLIHLECSPDVTPGTFASWLDNCGTHTCKKLIERNIWTVEQVAALSSDQVDELRYKEGCVHMDVVWEHARTVLVPLQARSSGTNAEVSSLQDRILELRKKREMERRRAEVIRGRGETVKSREATLQQLREQVERKRQALRQQQQARMQQQQGDDEEDDDDDDDDDDGADAEDVVEELGKQDEKPRQ